ncbi:hypothetical protein JGB96_23540, partial [Salmonella enterica subsp. enterica serovar Derby]|nr:hypothetical protein [Salmonella enterica subsp. enterica serovar Derby]
MQEKFYFILIFLNLKHKPILGMLHHNTKLILREALGCSALDIFLDTVHSNIRLLSGLDPMHQGWLHNQGSKGTMLNQTQVETLKFLQKGRLKLLEQQ